MTTVAEERETLKAEDRIRARFLAARDRFRDAEQAHRAAHGGPAERIDSQGRRHVVRDHAEAVVLRNEAAQELNEAAAEFEAAKAELLIANTAVANLELEPLRPKLERADRRAVKAAADVEKATANLIAAGWQLNDTMTDRKRLVLEAVRVANGGAVNDDERERIKADARMGTVAVALGQDGRVADQVTLGDLDDFAGQSFYTGVGPTIEAGADRGERVWSDNKIVRQAVAIHKRSTKG